MKIKERSVAIIIVLLIILIFCVVVFARANEGLDKYEKQEIQTEEVKYLSKGAS
ncbi:hypothetical protein [Staphylococcus auricularis]|uniref:hypothetical protein n=1 Tax=Staphylococcus auricularis TaxID=29379 RepID=UPI00248EA341|nr:hypothetical protein [Staphylococcus auricularis]